MEGQAPPAKSFPEQAFFLLAGILLAYQLAVFGALAFWSDGRDLVLPAIFGSGSILLFDGLRNFRVAPLRGGVLVAIGVVPSILLYWVVAASLIGSVVAAYSLLSINGRAKKLRLAQSTSPLADGIHPPA